MTGDYQGEADRAGDLHGGADRAGVHHCGADKAGDLHGEADRAEDLHGRADRAGGSAVRATFFEEAAAGAIGWGSLEVAYAAQTQHKAIPIMGSASDRGISAGTRGLK